MADRRPQARSDSTTLRPGVEEQVANLVEVPEPIGADLGISGLGLVPALVPHDVRNIGDETVRVVGFFSSATVVSVFDDPLMPAGRRVVGTPLPEEAEVAPAAAAF